MGESRRPPRHFSAVAGNDCAAAGHAAGRSKINATMKTDFLMGIFILWDEILPTQASFRKKTCYGLHALHGFLSVIRGIHGHFSRQTRISLTTRPCTSVRRKLRPS